MIKGFLKRICKEGVNIFCILMIGFFLMWVAVMLSARSITQEVIIPYSDSGITNMFVYNIRNAALNIQSYNPFFPADPQKCCSSYPLAAIWKTGYLLMFLGYPVLVCIRLLMRFMRYVMEK